MPVLIGVLILSFIVSSLLFVPFINLLYDLNLKRAKQEGEEGFRKRTPIFSKFNAKKAGTPVGGGLLIIAVTTLLFFLTLIVLHYFWFPITSLYKLGDEVKIIFFTFVFFALIGVYDDIKKIFPLKSSNEFGLRMRHKLILEIILATMVSLMLYFRLDIQIVHVPLLGVFKLGLWYIPFAAFVIVSFTNAYNITDGLDGLAAGLLFIALAFFWVISASILDTVLSIFIAILLGSLVAFLYFNVYPARIFLGDVGALSFGATLAVIGLILGKTFALLIIGSIFVAEVTTSLLQIFYRNQLGKKFIPVAPLHLYLQYKGWPEPKIVMRAWLAGLIMGMIGLFLSYI